MHKIIQCDTTEAQNAFLYKSIRHPCRAWHLNANIRSTGMKYTKSVSGYHYSIINIVMPKLQAFERINLHLNVTGYFWGNISVTLRRSSGCVQQAAPPEARPPKYHLLRRCSLETAMPADHTLIVFTIHFSWYSWIHKSNDSSSEWLHRTPTDIDCQGWYAILAIIKEMQHDQSLTNMTLYQQINTCYRRLELACVVERHDLAIWTAQSWMIDSVSTSVHSLSHRKHQ